MLNFSFYSVLVLFVIVCMFLILLILIQKGRGGGLSSAFGGASGNTAFGSKTGDVLTWATSIVFGIFIVLAIILNLISNSMDKKHRQLAAQQNAALVAPAPMPSMPGLPAGLLPSDTQMPAEPAAKPTPAPAAAPAATPPASQPAK